ncbi:MAG: sulfotransferase [Myxococcota bacterium]
MVDAVGSLEAMVEQAYHLATRPGGRPSWPPLFIVGTPRSGTTVVYQHLVHTFRCGYVPNISERHPRAPVVAARIGQLVGGRTASYQSDFGETEGMLGPSDGWRLFHRWFPRYEIDRPVDPAVFDTLPGIVAGLESVFDGPFFNKNNHNSVRVSALARIFPDAFFLRVTRDRAQTAMSLLTARAKHDVGVGEWWSCPAPQFLEEAFESQLEQTAATVAGIEAHLDAAMDSLPSNRAITVEYASFCDAPSDLVDAVGKHYESAGQPVTRREQRPAPSLEASVRDEIPDALVDALDEFAHRLEVAPDTL